MSPKAPGSLVFAVDAVFKGQNPLTITKNSKDEIYSQKQEEIHILKFESCILRQGTQQEMLFKGGFQNLLAPLKALGNDTFAQPWLVTDIDNILHGNPYVLSKNQKIIS